MPLIAELHLHGDIILFEETFERVPDAECYFEGVHYLTEGGHTRYVFFWWCSGCDFAAFESALGDDPTVRYFHDVTELDGRRLYRVETVSFPPDQPLVFPSLRETDSTVLEATRDVDGLHLRVRFPSRAALRDFREAGAAIADHVDVNRLYTEESTDRTAGLTAKQREALALAFERGYFETPSRATLEELSEEAGVTPQALSDHIRAGVRELVEDALEDAV